jgi:hypothetical protein
MMGPAANNDLLLAMLTTLAGADVDVEPARIAFETTGRDFAARFAAAIEAQIARLAKPEVVIEIPDRPEDLTKRELEDLVRPAEVRFLKSYPTKTDLLEHLELIKRRQERRPAWVPMVDRAGRPIPATRRPRTPMGVIDQLGPRTPEVCAARRFVVSLASAGMERTQAVSSEQAPSIEA